MSLQIFNYAEAAVWFAIALALCIIFLVKKMPSPMRLNTLIATLAFFAFGISDIIEAHTGRWWHPPSLLALNVGCVLVLIICYARYRKLREK